MTHNKMDIYIPCLLHSIEKIKSSLPVIKKRVLKYPVDSEPFPPGQTRRLSRLVSNYLSFQPVFPSKVTNRPLGTAVVGVVATCRVGGCLWADLRELDNTNTR